MKKKIVFLGMSGGVDSSLSAVLLKQQGYEVVGVFIRTWHPSFLECTEENERHDAMRVAAHLDIPFLTFDFEDIYKKEVADYMIDEYKQGRTPNPDVMCNKEIKFGAFLEKAMEMGADYVATGHYSINELGIKNYELKKAKDPSKDQCYFLWTLNQKQLSKIIFPIGHLEKTEVRKLAQKFKLPSAEKKDSQGICFLGQVDLKKFLKHYIPEKKGKILNEKGEVIGNHEGVLFYTLGERHGFNITYKKSNDKPYYIFAKDLKKNILYVSSKKNFHFSSSLSRGRLGGGFLKSTSPQPSPYKGEGFCLNLKDVNWISEIPKENKNYSAQIRYHGEFLSCQIKINTKNKAEVIFKKPILVASGQSCVIYDKNICLGGGVVI